MKNILGHKWTQIVVSIFILLAVYIIIYPPDIKFFQRSSEFAVHLMFGLLIASFVLLIFNQSRLMFITMLASGLLAFYLKTASNSNMILPQVNNLPKLTVAHFNLSSFDAYDSAFNDRIKKLDPDLISFQEYTPNWDAYLSRDMKEIYPHSHRMVRIDPFGMAIYSKKEIKNVSSFFYEDIPNLHATLKTEVQDVDVISAYIIPPSMKTKKISAKAHLLKVAEQVIKVKNPSLVLGDFNQVYWSNDINSFREKTNLNNSRRNINITDKVPYDHIFYSDLLECIGFSEIKGENQVHLGINGIFQAKSAVTNPAILRSIGSSNNN